MIVRALWALAPRRPFRAPSRGIFGQSFEVGEIQAVRRNEVGSKNAQWARQHQLIPGIVYGYDEEGRDAVDLVYVKEQDLRREVNRRGRSFSNTLYDIEIDGKKQRVIPRDFRVHPFRAKALSINWLRYREGAYPGVRIEIPLKSINGERCPALKEGGWLIELTSKLPVYANGPVIPDTLLMDLRGRKAGDKVMASQVELNDGLTLRSKVRTFAIARLLGSRRGLGGSADDDPAAPAAAAGGAAAKPAAGGAAGGKAAAGGATPAAKGGEKKAGGGDKK